MEFGATELGNKICLSARTELIKILQQGADGVLKWRIRIENMYQRTLATCSGNTTINDCIPQFSPSSLVFVLRSDQLNYFENNGLHTKYTLKTASSNISPDGFREEGVEWHESSTVIIPSEGHLVSHFK